jgi:hypothetical protein
VKQSNDKNALCAMRYALGALGMANGQALPVEVQPIATQN